MKKGMMVWILMALIISSGSLWTTAQAGQITFEQFRMLSTGMTEGQVLAQVGSPDSRFVTSCILTQQMVTCPTIWTYIMPDGWTADLTFSAGRLVDIRNTKRP
jgi:hypothetical protein